MDVSHVLHLCVAKAKINKHGEWNKIRVEAVGSTIRTYINGVNFANLVDDVRKEGFIALQVHGIWSNEELSGREIAWRNIRIVTEEPGKYMLSDVELSPEVSYLTNDLTPKEKEEGWKLLWDGVSTEGWRGARRARATSRSAPATSATSSWPSPSTTSGS